MRLDLDDFSSLQTIKDSKKIQHSEGNLEERVRHLEEQYQKKIDELKKEYDILLEKRSKESFEEGYQEAKKSLQALFDERLKEELEKKEKEKVDALNREKEKLFSILKSYEEKDREYLEKFKDILLNNLEEIFYYLYIDESNIKLIKRVIKEIIDDFKQHTPLVIGVSPNLYKQVKDLFNGIEVKAYESLGENDFIIEFNDFKIESNIREKLQVIKDEIKTEIKKLT